MIYAKFIYDEHYSDMHDEMLACIVHNFERVEHGHQGDSWIWIHQGANKAAIDTFSAMQHEVKSQSSDLMFIQQVVDVLKNSFTLQVYTQPELESHED